jgi:hypothetical protein
MTAVSRPWALGRLRAGSSAVSEQNAGVAVLPINLKRVFAPIPHRVVGAGHDELLGDFQGVDKPRAGRFEIEGGRAVCANLR